MADRSQNPVSRLQASASMASVGGQDEAEIPMLNGVDDMLPQFPESASQVQTVQPARTSGRVCPSCIVDEEDDVIPVEEVESDFDLGSGGSSMEDSEVYFEIDDDEGAYGVAEGQHQNHLPTSSTPAVAAALKNRSGAIPVVFTDPDVLDCPICLEPLFAPIYQCENGHIACSPCCTKLNRKCPSCCLPIGFNRCLAMEKVMESIRVDCEFKLNGCREPLIYHKKAEHEQVCIHTLCFCPLSSCSFAGSYKNLYSHFSTHHSSSATFFTFDTTFHLVVRRDQKHTILQERNDKTIFILNHDIQEHGRVFNVDCVGPNSFRNYFVYKLSVRCSDTCFSLESVPEVCAKWEEHTPNNKRLTIPSEFLRFTIDVCIKRAHRVL